MKLLKILFLASVLAVVTTAAAYANSRTISTIGTAPVGGSVHITIEDFGKPGRRDPIGPLSQPAATTFDVFVTVLPGWTCAQTTVAMFNELAATLPPVYSLQIDPKNPCVIYISRQQQGGVIWNLNIAVEVVGLIILVEDVVVPQVPATWSFIKSPGFNQFR